MPTSTVSSATSDNEADQAAVVIQSRIRGAQERRRAVAKSLTLARDGDLALATGRLDVDVGSWLRAHDEPDIVHELRTDFECHSLRDLLAIIQDPADCGMFIDDADRCHVLWKALQHEIAECLRDRDSQVQAVRSTADPATGDSDCPTDFGLIYVSGIKGQLQDEDELKGVFGRFGTVQAVHMRQDRRSSDLWALVTFMSVTEAQVAIDAAPDLHDHYSCLVSSGCYSIIIFCSMACDVNLPFLEC